MTLTVSPADQTSESPNDLRAVWDTAYVDDLPDSAFAYVEPGGEKDGGGKTTPRSLRHFPHHNAAGELDRAHVVNAAARIPQSDVSAEGRAEAEAHIDAHEKTLGIADNDADADEKKSRHPYQQRAFSFDFRVEQRHRGAVPTLVGHAAVFDQVADLGYFRERISPGAFSRTLREGGPVYALWNHNPDYIIASTKNGSLRLSEDKTGLLAEMEPMDTPTIRDLVVKPMQEGMVDKMSFGFTCVRDSMGADGVRNVDDADLFDVSPVTFPAYEGTDVQARVSRIAGRIRRGLPVPSEDEELFHLIDSLARSLARSGGNGAASVVSAGALAASVRERELILKKGNR